MEGGDTAMGWKGGEVYGQQGDRLNLSVMAVVRVSPGRWPARVERCGCRTSDITLATPEGRTMRRQRGKSMVGRSQEHRARGKLES